MHLENHGLLNSARFNFKGVSWFERDRSEFSDFAIWLDKSLELVMRKKAFRNIMRIKWFSLEVFFFSPQPTSDTGIVLLKFSF